MRQVAMQSDVNVNMNETSSYAGRCQCEYERDE